MDRGKEFEKDLLNEVEGRLCIKGKILKPIWNKGEQYARIQFNNKIWHCSIHNLQFYMSHYISGAQVAQEITIPFIQGIFKSQITFNLGLG